MSTTQSNSETVSPTDDRVSSLEQAIHSSSFDVLATTASHTGLNEDLALTLLKRNDLPPRVLELLSKNHAAMKSRKLKLALVQHPKTPRNISLPLLRHLFTFDLMQAALAPAAAADVKKTAEKALLDRLETISLGGKVSLARRASARVADALLLDADPRVTKAALENPYLTETVVLKALVHRDAGSSFVQLVCRHPKWSLRREVRIALLRNKNIPLARALEFARGFPPPFLEEILQASSLPAKIKSQLLQETSK